ncbi:hypothetical protein DYB28_003020 [Aphanomyces astaci]|uniref:Tyrosine specific protein phosphatases domain-containing protein n=1 Tax=Aphanomyces astaci TaxID=112090 RepID=A0A397FKZ4_APHAT|nr:hypothetical protein DYB34_004102 [Aphanomyces astaci]RHY73993.1 hypothetical protein DYB30_001907 [Aphanomyces astaci]RHZ31231.1 hypothetical protein DYB31_010324 [Aphanomyces astaci]RLO01142.1 hypothetical protein DYB28_003020 [Aphanomyces astaci]
MESYTAIQTRALRYFVALHAAYMQKRGMSLGGDDASPHGAPFDLRCPSFELHLENFYLLAVHKAADEVVADAERDLHEVMAEEKLSLLPSVRSFITRERFDVAVHTDKQQVVPGMWLTSALSLHAMLELDETSPPKFRRTLVCCTKREPAPLLESDGTIDLMVDDEHTIDFALIVKRLRERKAVCPYMIVYCDSGISLSGAVCIAYIMATHFLPLDAAMAVVRAARRLVEPSDVLLSSLQVYASKLKLDVDSVDLFGPL